MAPTRPRTWSEFAGQPAAVNVLRVAVQAARKRLKPLAHTLLTGPAGLGKTTLSLIVAAEMGARIETINCAGIERPADLVAVLCGAEKGSIVFLDEIHALQGTGCFDYLLSCLEDQYITIPGQTPKEAPLKISLEPFTVIGATTREAALPEPIRDRFPNRAHLRLYQDPEMLQVLEWTANARGLVIETPDLQGLVKACHGTARWAVRLIDAVQDTVLVRDGVMATAKDVAETLDRLEFRHGLTRQERDYLAVLARNGAPMGLKALAQALDEDPITLETITEPWLVQEGFIIRGPQGRSLTKVQPIAHTV